MLNKQTKNLLFIGIIFLSSACSPLYVLRAGWEEAGILLRRKEISKIIEDEGTEQKVRDKLQLVLEAREYSEKIGLIPKDSFTQYSKIDREVLVWVLSAAHKTKLEPVTWWYPVVGRVPYKGFFDKEDAVQLFEELKKEDKDVYLRPSAAFSTLGWFNDPLLSTMIDFGDISLVSTVFHEITHNTVWLPNHVPFNETLANVVGANATIQFFGIKSPEKFEKAKNAWNDEVVYSRYLKEVFDRLDEFYTECAKQTEMSEGDIIDARKKVFEELKSKWSEFEPEIKTKRYGNIAKYFNNAVLLAQKAYYEKTWVFAELLELHKQSIPDFLESISKIIEKSKKSGDDPFELMRAEIQTLASAKENIHVE